MNLTGVVLYIPASTRSVRTRSTVACFDRPATAVPILVATASAFFFRSVESDSSSVAVRTKLYRPMRFRIAPERVPSFGLNAPVAAAMASARMISPMMRRMIIGSHLDVHDSLDDQRPSGERDPREHEQSLAARRVVEDPDVVRVDEVDDEEQKDGEERQHPARHAALGGQRADGPPQLESLTDRLGDASQDLRGVAAGLMLERRH